MKRKDISITNEKIIAFCRAEQQRRKEVNKTLIAKGEMAIYTANEEYLILQEYKELAELLHRKNLNMDQLRKLLNKRKDRKEPIQGKLIF